MKSNFINFLVLIIAICIASCLKLDNQGPEIDTDTYHNGEILLPNSIHRDTLIVVNAATLNKIIKEDHIAADGSDSEIFCITTEQK